MGNCCHTEGTPDQPLPLPPKPTATEAADEATWAQHPRRRRLQANRRSNILSPTSLHSALQRQNNQASRAGTSDTDTPTHTPASTPTAAATAAAAPASAAATPVAAAAPVTGAPAEPAAVAAPSALPSQAPLASRPLLSVPLGLAPLVIPAVAESSDWQQLPSAPSLSNRAGVAASADPKEREGSDSSWFGSTRTPVPLVGPTWMSATSSARVPISIATPSTAKEKIDVTVGSRAGTGEHGGKEKPIDLTKDTPLAEETKGKTVHVPSHFDQSKKEESQRKEHAMKAPSTTTTTAGTSGHDVGVYPKVVSSVVDEPPSPAHLKSAGEQAGRTREVGQHAKATTVGVSAGEEEKRQHDAAVEAGEGEPQVAEDVQKFALPVGTQPVPEISQGWQVVERDSSKEPLSSQLQRRASYVWSQAEPKLRQAYAYTSGKVRQTASKVRDVGAEMLAKESTQTTARNLAEMGQRVGQKYIGSIQCMAGQFRELPSPVKSVTLLSLFLHVLVPLMYLDLPESWTCLKFSFVGYAVCHGLVHFSETTLPEALIWSHVFGLTPMLLTLFLTPGTESLVVGMPGWPLMVYSRYPSDLYLYLLWLRSTIAFTCTVLVLDAITIQRARMEAATAATPMPIGVGAPTAKPTTFTAASAPSSPTITFSSVPPSSKLHVTMEAPPAEVGAAATESKHPAGHRIPYPNVSSKEEEIKQPAYQRESSVKIEELPTPSPSAARDQPQVPIPSPS